MRVVLESATSGIVVWPERPRIGDRIHVAIKAARIIGAMSVPRYEVTVLDARRRRVATLLRGRARAVASVVCVEWDGVDDAGARVAPGIYRLRVRSEGSPELLEKTLELAG